MRFVCYITILVLVSCALLGFAVKIGFGSRDQSIGDYQVHVPIGWNVLIPKSATSDLASSTSTENPKWLAAINWLGGALEIKILTPEYIRTEAENYREHRKRERGFPELAPGMHATATAISNLMINDIPFQRVDWSCKGTDLIPPQSRSIFTGPIPDYPVIWGFEFRSLPFKNKDIIRCEAKTINVGSLHSAEEIVLSLKRRTL